MVTSRIDYCCSLFLSLPNKQLKMLQTVLNRAARQIFNLKPKDSAMPSQIIVHLLPIEARIEFEICLRKSKFHIFTKSYDTSEGVIRPEYQI